MNSEFSVFKLGEVAEIIAGGDKPTIFSEDRSDLNRIPVFANAEKKNGLQGYTDTPRIVEPAVTVAARGSNVGFVAVRREPFFPIVRLLSLIPSRERLDVDYLFYNLKQNRQKGTGSGQPQITIPDISNRSISLPSLLTQQKISKVLSDLDAKIELNNKINAELEAMAKTLYDYWFVQFDFPNAEGKPYKSSGGEMVYDEVLKREIPKGWEAEKIVDLGTVVGGSTPSKAIYENFNQNGTPWITPKDLSLNVGNKFISKGELDVSEKGLKEASLTVLPPKSVLMSSRAPVGYLAINRVSCTTNQGFKSLVCNKGYECEYVYYVLNQYMPVIEANATGSTFKEISGSVFKSISILKPKKQVVDEFIRELKPIFAKQDNLEQQNQELASLRDWLLPMLMNGQVKVVEAYKEVEEKLAMVAEGEQEYKLTR